MIIQIIIATVIFTLLLKYAYGNLYKRHYKQYDPAAPPASKTPLNRIDALIKKMKPKKAETLYLINPIPDSNTASEVSTSELETEHHQHDIAAKHTKKPDDPMLTAIRQAIIVPRKGIKDHD